MDKLRALRPEFEKVFYDPEQFKEMYKYTFTYAKNRDQKCMEVDVSCLYFNSEKELIFNKLLWDRLLQYYGLCY